MWMDIHSCQLRCVYTLLISEFFQVPKFLQGGKARNSSSHRGYIAGQSLNIKGKLGIFWCPNILRMFPHILSYFLHISRIFLHIFHIFLHVFHIFLQFFSSPIDRRGGDTRIFKFSRGELREDMKHVNILRDSSGHCWIMWRKTSEKSYKTSRPSTLVQNLSQKWRS